MPKSKCNHHYSVPSTRFISIVRSRLSLNRALNSSTSIPSPVAACTVRLRLGFLTPLNHFDQVLTGIPVLSLNSWYVRARKSFGFNVLSKITACILMAFVGVSCYSSKHSTLKAIKPLLGTEALSNAEGVFPQDSAPLRAAFIMNLARLLAWMPVVNSLVGVNCD